MNSRAGRGVALMMLLAVAAMPVRARAQTAPAHERLVQARQLVRDGRQKLAEGAYEEALRLFMVADGLVGKPITRLGVAQALAGLGRFVEARKVANGVADMPAPPAEHPALVEARRRAAALAKELAGRVAYLDVRVRPATADARFLLDGKRLADPRIYGVEVDSGRHVLQVVAKGHRLAGRTFTVEPGEHLSLVVQLVPLQARGAVRPRPAMMQEPTTTSVQDRGESTDGLGLSWVTWAGFAGTGLGLVAGVPLGVLVLGRAAELKEACTLGAAGNACPSHLHGKRRDTLVMAHTSTAAMAIAAAGAGVSLVGLFAIDRVQELNAVVGPVVGPGFVGVRGTFE